MAPSFGGGREESGRLIFLPANDANTRCESSLHTDDMLANKSSSEIRLLESVFCVCVCVCVCVRVWLYWPICSQAAGRHMPRVTLQLKRTPTFCAQLSEISLPPLQTFPAHKPRSPKNAMWQQCFSVGSRPWDISAQEAECLFAKVTCSSSLPASTLHPL